MTGHAAAGKNDRLLKTRVLIIGGGVTGTGLARDLALRGIPCLLAEKKDLDAGASGGNHGLLHSGARYVMSDGEAAKECRIEGEILKRMVPHCVEDTGGLFVAVEGDDERYAADFPAMCARAGISADLLDAEEARAMAPALSDHLVAAFRVGDATIDPFKLAIDNMAQAVSLNADCLLNTRVTGFDIAGRRIRAAYLEKGATGEILRVEVDEVVNATGAWCGDIAGLAGIDLPMIFSKGTLLVTQSRITRQVINRLRPPADGDILVPGGTVSILGTTSLRVSHPDDCRPTIREADQIIREGAAVVPMLATARYIRAYAGVRPLIAPREAGSDRAVSRGFSLMDHGRDGIENFSTITGGKLTTYRLMAEKTADHVCSRLGISAGCRTRTDPLPPAENGRWTEPGLGPKLWASRDDLRDVILCECEMVSRNTVDALVDSLRRTDGIPTLRGVGLRSRIGKGPCQGGFCSARIAAHLYDTGVLTGTDGPAELRSFLQERWRGKRPVLWDLSLAQAELQEALHCGFYGLEL